MAQAAPAPQVTPSVTIKIKNGLPDQQDAYILVGQEVEIHNTDNTPYEIPFNVLIPGGTSNFPLSIILPAGGKLDLIGMEKATCQYWVYAAPIAGRDKKLEPMTGPYTIGVGSGEPGGGKSNRSAP